MFFFLFPLFDVSFVGCSLSRSSTRPCRAVPCRTIVVVSFFSPPKGMADLPERVETTILAGRQGKTNRLETLSQASQAVHTNALTSRICQKIYTRCAPIRRHLFPLHRSTELPYDSSSTTSPHLTKLPNRPAAVPKTHVQLASKLATAVSNSTVLQKALSRPNAKRNRVSYRSHVFHPFPPPLTQTQLYRPSTVTAAPIDQQSGLKESAGLKNDNVSHRGSPDPTPMQCLQT